jgi:ficolin
MAYRLGMEWSTYDRDNDLWTYNCAKGCHGAWWYRNCDAANLNGLYNSTSNWFSNSWYFWLGKTYPLKATEMKIRPAD